MSCDVCAVGERHPQLIRYSLSMNDRLILVDHVPAVVCNRCGEVTLSPDVVERLQQTVWQTRASGQICRDAGLRIGPSGPLRAFCIHTPRTRDAALHRNHAGGRPVCSRLAIITGTAVARGLAPPIRQARPPTHLVTTRERFARRLASSHTLRTACDTLRIPCAPSVRT